MLHELDQSDPGHSNSQQNFWHHWTQFLGFLHWFSLFLSALIAHLEIHVLEQLPLTIEPPFLHLNDSYELCQHFFYHCLNMRQREQTFQVPVENFFPH